MEIKLVKQNKKLYYHVWMWERDIPYQECYLPEYKTFHETNHLNP